VASSRANPKRLPAGRCSEDSAFQRPANSIETRKDPTSPHPPLDTGPDRRVAATRQARAGGGTAPRNPLAGLRGCGVSAAHGFPESTPGNPRRDRHVSPGTVSGVSAAPPPIATPWSGATCATTPLPSWRPSRCIGWPVAEGPLSRLRVPRRMQRRKWDRGRQILHCL